MKWPCHFTERLPHIRQVTDTCQSSLRITDRDVGAQRSDDAAPSRGLSLPEPGAQPALHRVFHCNLPYRLFSDSHNKLQLHAACFTPPKITSTTFPAQSLLWPMCTKSLRSCLTLCGPQDCSPPGSSVHGDSPGKNTGVGWNLPDLGTEPKSLTPPVLAGGFFTSSTTWKPISTTNSHWH